MRDAPEVVSALMDSAAMRRLHGVSQAGAPALRKSTRNATRFQHSIGVWAIAKHLGLSVEDQVTALLHDVTHTAFSHTADYLLKNRAEDSHEKQLSRLHHDREILRLVPESQLNQLIQTVIQRPYWLKMIDALDYTTRDLVCAGLLRSTEREDLIRELTLTPDGPAFLSKEAAGRFLCLMEQAATELYEDWFDLFLHQELACLLEAAIDADLLAIETIVTGEDKDVIATLAADAKFAEHLSSFLEVGPGDIEPTGERIYSKSRLIMPLVVVGSGTSAPLDCIEPKWLDFIEASRSRASRGVPLYSRRIVLPLAKTVSPA